ncbi:MAG: DUF1178 family protein [Paracoccaceae bacterium]
MIQYTLKCADGHRFDSWFQSGEAFDRLAKAGMVSCAICGASKVEKAIMAPRVRPARNGAVAPETAQVEEQEKPSKPTLSTPNGDLEKAVTELRKKVEENSDYVGSDFAREARAMHVGDAPERSIYGEAKPEEAKSLIEDGVQVLPLPFMPNRKTN